VLSRPESSSPGNVKDALNLLEAAISLLGTLFREPGLDSSASSTGRTTLDRGGQEPAAEREVGVSMAQRRDDAPVRFDPSEKLDLLVELNLAIHGLEAVQNSPYANELSVAANKALFGHVQLADKLTDSFLPIQALAAPADPILRFAPGHGLMAYKVIDRYVGPPFSVETRADLAQLQRYINSEAERLAAEINAPNVTVPIVNLAVPREQVLLAGPIALLVFTHFLGWYTRRSKRLRKRIYSDPTVELQDSDYRKFDPRFVLMPGFVDADQQLPTGWTARWIQLTRLLMALLVLGIPVWTAIAVVLGAAQLWETRPVATLVALVTGLTCCVLIFVELIGAQKYECPENLKGAE